MKIPINNNYYDLDVIKDFMLMENLVLEEGIDLEPCNGGFKGLCPFHGDTNPSFYIYTDTNTYHCFGGCDGSSIFDFIMKSKDIDFHTARDYLANKAGVKPLENKIYYYYNESNEAVIRKIKKPNKDFWWEHYHNNGDVASWVNGMNGEHLLYNLHNIINNPSGSVFIVEGEKDADTLINKGYLATTFQIPGKFYDEYKEFLEDRNLYIIPDNDDAGQKSSDKIIKALYKISRVHKIVINDYNDVTEWFDKGHTINDFDDLVANSELITSIEKCEINENRSYKIYSVAELLEKPELLESPEKIGPWLGWRGLSTLFSNAPKGGKTTFALSDAVKAAQDGYKVFWIYGSGDSNVRQLLQKIDALDIDQEIANNFFMLGNGIINSWDAFDKELNEIKPDIVYVDTLSSVLNGFGEKLPDTNKPEEWHDLSSSWKKLALKHNCAVVVLHHNKKNSDDPRGSTGIMAAFDMLLSLHHKKDLERTLFAVGRIYCADGKVYYNPKTEEYRGNQLITGASKKEDVVKVWLINILEFEPLPKSKILELGKKMGYTNYFIDRAANKLNIVKGKMGGTPIPWELPESDLDENKADEKNNENKEF